jgi:hypothetical protein
MHQQPRRRVTSIASLAAAVVGGLSLSKLLLQISFIIGVADELPVHYRGGVGKSEKRRG